jgi:ABC-2 type transport system permease protein
VRKVFDPGVTWNGWQVPVGLELGIVMVIGLLMLGVAVLEFRRAE